MPTSPLNTAESASQELSFVSAQMDTIVTFSPEVLAHFDENRQVGKSKNEVGGQLFANISGSSVRIVRATGPNKSDKRGWAWFTPDRLRQNLEIKELFASGLHFVGDWHTHPENTPTPSSVDLESMEECFNKSRHQLRAFVMAIVGRSPFPTGLWVSLHGKIDFEQMVLISDPTVANTKIKPATLPKA